MHVFYTPDLKENFYTLDEQESKHCTQVLRLSAGAVVALVDGNGGYFTAEITAAGKKKVELKILTSSLEHGKRNFSLHVAVAPTKNIERIEWFLEKATEMGIGKVTPIISARSERKIVKQDRLEKVITSAIKQSMQAYHPVLEEALTFNDFIKSVSKGNNFIAHCEPGEKQFIKELLNPGEDCLILIGPEGDFTPQEIDLALKSGFKAITLGTSRLRTETAALAACFEVNYINR